MSQMTDPMKALVSFQDAFLRGPLHLEKGRVDPGVYMHLDHPEGKPRFTYVRIEKLVVTALANFTPNGSVEGALCLALGYAVPEQLRGQGRAQDIVRAGLAELQNGFKDFPGFFVEAVVSIGNAASLRVAQLTIGGRQESIADALSGEKAIRYTNKFGGETKLDQ